MSRKLGDGWLTRAEIRAIRRLLILAEQKAGPVDNGDLDDQMRKLALGCVAGLEGKVPAEMAVAYNKWIHFCSDRSTRRAWIGDHRTQPSLLALRRCEAKGMKPENDEPRIQDLAIPRGIDGGTQTHATLIEHWRANSLERELEFGVGVDRVATPHGSGVKPIEVRAPEEATA